MNGRVWHIISGGQHENEKPQNQSRHEKRELGTESGIHPFYRYLYIEWEQEAGTFRFIRVHSSWKPKKYFFF